MRIILTLLTLISSQNVFATQKIEIDANTKLEKNGYNISYNTKYAASKSGAKGQLIRQRIVKFYNQDKFQGSYLHFQKVGSGLPSAITHTAFQVSPKTYDLVKIEDRFFDIDLHGGHFSNKELSRWFTITWSYYNSCIPHKEHRHYLCLLEDLPKMDDYLIKSGFTIHAILKHSFTLKKNS